MPAKLGACQCVACPGLLLCFWSIGIFMAATDNRLAGYVKVINGRCSEREGILPLGEPDRNWTKDLDERARDWCHRRDWCVGYMRYLGDDPAHCAAWCGRPQFCDAVSFSQDDQWAAYVREESLAEYAATVAAASEAEAEVQGEEVPAIHQPEQRGPLEVECSWPYSGSTALWFEEPPLPAEGEGGGGPSAVADDECRVLHHRRGQPPPRRKGAGSSIFHGILSEDEGLIAHFTADTHAEPWLYSTDDNEFIGETVELGGETLGPKRHFLSVFFLSSRSACDGQAAGQWGPDETEEVLPGHVFVDDGLAETRRGAFNPYHFTVICGGLEEAGFIPQAVVDAIGFATHPLVPRALHKKLHRSFFHLPDAVQAYTRIHPVVLEHYLEDIYSDPGKNEAMYYKQSFLFLLQDLFRYRYRQAPAVRVEVYACALCEERRRRQRLAEALVEAKGAAATVGVAFCVMSRRSGHALRATIRETWAQRVTNMAVLRFFCGPS